MQCPTTTDALPECDMTYATTTLCDSLSQQWRCEFETFLRRVADTTGVSARETTCEASNYEEYYYQ